MFRAFQISGGNIYRNICFPRIIFNNRIGYSEKFLISVSLMRKN